MPDSDTPFDIESFRQLERDRERLLAILSGMVEGVVAIDRDRRVLFANDRAGQLLGFEPAAVTAATLSDVITQAAVTDLLEKALAAGTPQRVDLEWAEPVSRHLSLYAARLPGEESRGAVLVLNDITELRQLERLRHDFVANASHELKTPISVIKSNVEALQDGAAKDPALQTSFLERINFEADRLNELIQDMMRLARIESGDLFSDRVAIPVAGKIERAFDRHSTRAEAKSLQLIELPPREPVAVFADDEALTTIIENLVDNAIKYSTSGGRITARWSAEGPNVVIAIQDTGIGIAAEDLPRVFERFFRADKARSRAAGGTGLGLAIVKHLVQVMGGAISVTSELGKGSTFIVTLPQAEAF
jgi:two-component system phosphate regulon sensor histidine kinase PhoR